MEAKQTDLNRLLVGTKTFVIPQFQRHYKWKRQQWAELFQDLIDQYHDPDVQSGTLHANEGHFLGSLVLHPTPGPASTVAEYWVIDGQQRLITLQTLIAAVRDFRKSSQLEWDPAEYDEQYLRNRFSTDRPYRLKPGENDRESFISTVFQGAPEGLIGDAYRYFTRRLDELNASEPIDFSVLHNALFLRLLVVEINTSKEDNINQIFHTINHAGLKLSAVDLIRNHAFMQIPPEEAEKTYRQLWQPLENCFDREADLARYIWAQLVRKSPKATQKDLYQPFAELVSKKAKQSSPEEATRKILEELRDETNVYYSLENPSEYADPSWSKPLFQVVKDLAAWGSIPSRPLTLEILSRLSQGLITDQDATDALTHLLSLLVRRTLCGVPTNNLNRQLSPVPSKLKEGPVANQVLFELSQESKYWPSDSDVLEKAPKTALYVSADQTQVKLILATLDRQLNPSEPVEVSGLTIVHVMPETLNDEWETYLQKNGASIEEANSRKHTLGNLTLTGRNSELARHPIERKAEIFSESNLPLNRLFSKQHNWLPKDIDNRGLKLAELAVAFWPKKAVERGANNQMKILDGEGYGANQFSVQDVVESMPVDICTTLDTISDVTSIDTREVENELRVLGYPVFTHSEGCLAVSGDKNLVDSPVECSFINAHDLAALIQNVGSGESE